MKRSRSLHVGPLRVDAHEVLEDHRHQVGHREIAADVQVRAVGEAQQPPAHLERLALEAFHRLPVVGHRAPMCNAHELAPPLARRSPPRDRPMGGVSASHYVRRMSQIEGQLFHVGFRVHDLAAAMDEIGAAWGVTWCAIRDWPMEVWLPGRGQISMDDRAHVLDDRAGAARAHPGLARHAARPAAGNRAHTTSATGSTIRAPRPSACWPTVGSW